MFDIVEETGSEPSLTPKTIVYVLVHGDPDPDNEGLSSLGKNQMDELARSRVTSGVTRIYTSPKKVCLETAGGLRRNFDASIKVKECLEGVCLPLLNQPADEIAEVLASYWDEGYTPEEGESLEKTRIRISDCVNDIASRHSSDSIAIVVPPILSVLLLSLVRGGEPRIEDWVMMGYCSCSTYQYSETGWELVMPPDNSFLSRRTAVKDKLPEGVLDQLGILQLKEDER
ncbi:MAG: histidine phosphatase family protein [Candidatus Thorarchaeota archaeon]